MKSRFRLNFRNILTISLVGVALLNLALIEWGAPEITSTLLFSTISLILYVLSLLWLGVVLVGYLRTPLKLRQSRAESDQRADELIARSKKEELSK